MIDLLTVISSLSGPTNEQIYGCRNQFAESHADQFCDRMIEAGARLVFFIDGMLQVEKYRHWIQRQEKVYVECLKKVEDSSRGFKQRSIGGNVTKHAFISALVAAARNKGTLKTSYDVECDREMAAYARKHNALAIITGDSDFLIFEGNFRIWSSLDLNLRHMNTKEWNRGKLLSALGLSQKQMPFFAAIAGNDQFRKRPGGMRSLESVARRVRELNLLHRSTRITEDLCGKIFNQGNHQYSHTSSFEVAVNFYDTVSAGLDTLTICLCSGFNIHIRIKTGLEKK